MIKRPILVLLVVFPLSFLWVSAVKGQPLDQHTRDLLKLFEGELDEIYDRYGGHKSKVTGEPWPKDIPGDEDIGAARGREKIRLEEIKRELEKRYGREKYKLLERARERKDTALAKLWVKYEEKGLMRALRRRGLELINKFLHLAEPGKDLVIEDRATEKQVPLRDFIKLLSPESPPKPEPPPAVKKPPQSPSGRPFSPKSGWWPPPGFKGGSWLFYFQDFFQIRKNIKYRKLQELKEEIDYLKRQEEQYEQSVKNVEEEIFTQQELRALERAGFGPQGTSVAELKQIRNEFLIKMEKARERRYDLRKQARQLEDALENYRPQTPAEQLGITPLQKK